MARFPLITEGLAWQPGGGRLYETEHGPSGDSYGTGQDEVNYIEPGKNYGWPVVHGEQTRGGMVDPIVQSGETVTWAPSGATFVTGGPGMIRYFFRVWLDKLCIEWCWTRMTPAK